MHKIKKSYILAAQKISDLPGVGWSTRKKLEDMGVQTCEQMQSLSLTQLQKSFGVKNGDSLYKSCRGDDPRPLRTEHERKSVSAEINYGMRFTKVCNYFSVLHLVKIFFSER